ncbi:MAG TPA: hypothetical protein VNE39_01295 [Planctomycetota bacterium]|nr:hypothetical protein [Planctomycetota bacterium]
MSKTKWPRVAKLRQSLRHAFSMKSPFGPLSEADRELLAQLALAIARRRMVGPAILFLESLRPLSYIGSQAMLFLRPFLTPLLNAERYDRLAEILERREGIEALVKAIERVSEKRNP